MKQASSYTIVQFLPDPDRQEAVNLGVLLYDADTARIFSRFVQDTSKIAARCVGSNKNFLNIAVGELKKRVDHGRYKSMSFDELKKFQSGRSNNIRLTPLLPTFSRDVEAEVERLFEALVGEADAVPRRPKVATRLRAGLRQLHALKYFDLRPEPVSLPRYNLVLRPDLAIRKSQLNLIEAARFDEPDIGISQAGKYALSGKALHSNLGMRLIVVGDFGAQSEDYYRAIKQDLEAANTKLYRMDQLSDLTRDFTIH